MLRAKVAKLEARLRELEVEQCETSSAGGASLSPEPSRGSSSSPGISLYMPPNGAPCFFYPRRKCCAHTRVEMIRTIFCNEFLSPVCYGQPV